MDQSLLTPLQRNLITTALTGLSILVIVACFFAAFLVLRGFVDAFSSVLWPLSLAVILVLLLRPVTDLFERRLHLSRIKSIALLYVTVLLLGFWMLTAFLPVLIEQALQLVTFLPVYFEDLREFLRNQFPSIVERFQAHFQTGFLDNFRTQFVRAIEEMVSLLLPAIREAGGFVGNLFAIAAGMAIVPVYLFYFLLADWDPLHRLDRELSFVRQEWREDIIFLIREFIGSIVAFFRGQLVIGLIMGILMSIGFTLVGLQFGIFLGLTLGILNVVPYLGTILGLAITLPIAFFQPEGGILLVALVLAVFILVQLLEGYLLTPRIMGEQTGLHPVAIIIAIFFWGTALNGILGMILAVPLTAFFVVAWRLVKHKYLEPLLNNRNDPSSSPASST